MAVVAILLCPISEDRAANADVSRAQRNRRGEIRAHPHREKFEAVTLRNLGCKCKVRAWRVIERWNTHETGYP